MLCGEQTLLSANFESTGIPVYRYNVCVCVCVCVHQGLGADRNLVAMFGERQITAKRTKSMIATAFMAKTPAGAK